MITDRYQHHRAVLTCFRHDPDFRQFLELARSPECVRLLRWLDESGLALYLAQRLQHHGLWVDIDPALQNALDNRVQANRRRTELLLSEFERVNAALQSSGVPFVFLKGFTLTDEFCPEPWLRHQSDIDVLVSPRSVAPSIKVLSALGYQIEPEEGSGEMCLAIRSKHIPSADDFIYDPPHHRHLEIHKAFYEPVCGVSLDVGANWAECITQRQIGNVQYPSLDLPHRFVLQVLHVFRHLSGWARLAWLYEIAYFTKRFEQDVELWRDIDSLVSNEKVRNACGVVCSIVSEAFATDFPEPVQQNWIGSLSKGQSAWIKSHAEGWMFADAHNCHKIGLLLHREFADSHRAWWTYRASRYARALKGIRKSERTGPRFLVLRIRRHLDYLWECLRWSTRSNFDSGER